MIKRFEYRAFLKSDCDEAFLKSACEHILIKLKADIAEGKYLQVCIYRYERMLFTYIETLCGIANPTEMFAEMNSCLELWPTESGPTHWTYMYPIYYQSIPDDVSEWLKERTPGKTKVGRIAWLKHETMFDYVYWHKAITDEGLLKGDKYQYISLHEDILFSYYEEPRNNVNITGKEGESLAIKGWLDIDPGAHFDLEKTNGPHFLVIEPLLIACEV